MSTLDATHEYQKKLGTEFGAIYGALWDEWAAAQWRLTEYRELFGKAEGVEFLNAISDGGFIGEVQHILWDDLMLRVCRLTDPPKSAGKDNLTVQRLPEFCKDPQLRTEVELRVQEAVQGSTFARSWRNRRISHADLARATTTNAEPLASASRRQIADALDAVHATLNTISVRLLDADTDNEVAGPPTARAFLSCTGELAKAVQFVDALIDPSGRATATDSRVASAFLRRLGCEPTGPRVRQILRMRLAARRFRGCSGEDGGTQVPVARDSGPLEQ